jgi:uncharacterized protein involved in exopolysaccharide biosynthesis
MSLPHTPALLPTERGRRPEAASGFAKVLAELPEILASHLRLILICAFLATVLVAGISLIQPKTYTSGTSFVPQTKPTLSGLAGLATQLGVNAASGEVGQSSQFYIELIRSHTVLWAVLNATYQWTTKDGASSGNLIRFYGMENLPAARRRDAALTKLGGEIGASVSRLTGMVVLRVTCTDPAIAQQIAQHVLEEVNSFNARTRQSQAAQERTFAEGRLTQMRGELEAAENRLQFFLQQNRDFKTSPRLSFDEDRLAREVAEKQQVVTSLAQSYEQARIEEVRDRSVITVDYLPDRPFRSNPRNVVKKTVVGFLFGILVGVAASMFSIYGIPLHRRRESTVGVVTV